MKMPNVLAGLAFASLLMSIAQAHARNAQSAATSREIEVCNHTLKGASHQIGSVVIQVSSPQGLECSLECQATIDQDGCSREQLCIRGGPEVGRADGLARYLPSDCRRVVHGAGQRFILQLCAGQVLIAMSPGM